MNRMRSLKRLLSLDPVPERSRDMSTVPTSRPAIAAEHVTKVIRQRTILSDIQVSLEPGSRVGLVGPNGAGKTTLLKILCGLWRPTSGVVKLGGRDIPRGVGPQGVGVVFEDARLYPFFTGRDHLRATARLHGIDPARPLERLTQWLSLDAFLDVPIRRLSLGQRQRVAVARALLPEPDLLLLDEPTNGLDPDGVRDLRTLLARLSEEQGVAVLISSHGLLDLARMVDRALFIREGKLVADEAVGGDLDSLDTLWQALYPRVSG